MDDREERRNEILEKLRRNDPRGSSRPKNQSVWNPMKIDPSRSSLSQYFQ
jgi:hypothetical protein